MLFNLALRHPERVLKNTLSALHSALKAAMSGSCTRGWCGGAAEAEAGRRRQRGPACDVRAAATHVSKVSAAKTLTDASIGWTSARGSPMTPKCNRPPTIKYKLQSLERFKHRM